MNKNFRSRRHFVKSSAAVVAGIAGSSLLSSCATFDDYLFDDKSTLNEEVVIIGGGISGLYLARRLRAKQQEFKLFEAGVTLGGRIRSGSLGDFGASVLKNSDKLAGELVGELHLQRQLIDKDHYFLTDGMGSLVDSLKENILGLIPYRNFRMRWQLIEVQKLRNEYELTFQLPDRQKKVVCRRLALAVPPSQWPRIKGLLQLPEMEMARIAHSNMRIEHAIRFILPASSFSGGLRSMHQTSTDEFDFRQVLKRHSAGTQVEVDVQYGPNLNFSIDYLYEELRKKLQTNFPFQRLTAEQFFSWQQASFINGAYFNLNWTYVSDKTSQFQLIGDSIAGTGTSRIEGALQSAKSAAEAFI